MNWILILIIGAAFSAIDQIIRLNWQFRSWLPAEFLNWDLGIGKIDAWHTYQGMVYFLLLAGGIHIGLGHFLKDGLYVLGLFLIVLFTWFQVRNLFMHVIFLKPEFWKFPFRQVL